MTIQLLKLAVRGPNAPTAEVTLGSPLTVISGSSDTGKSHVFQCIRFMLGGSEPPEGIPEAESYDRVCLDIELSGKRVRLERSLAGGNFQLYRALDNKIGEEKGETLKAKHNAEKPDNVSQVLLSHSELTGKFVRVDEWGKQRSLSFSDLRKLILVDEERIITRDSVFLRGQRQDATVEKSVAGLLLSGVDDSSIVPVERKKERDSRIQAESRLLQTLTAETRDLIGNAPAELPEIDEQLRKLNLSIDEATDTVSATQAEISAVETERQQIWDRLRPVRSRQLFVKTQIERFSLLREYSVSDRARLLAMIEAEDEINCLEQTDCPVCGRSPSESVAGQSIEETLESFTEACKSELVKLQTQEVDLASTIQTLSDEDAALVLEEIILDGRLREIDRRMSNLLRERQRTSREELHSLLSVRAEVLRRKVIAEEVARFTALQEETVVLGKTRVKKPDLAEKIEVRTTIGLCEEIQQLLTAWKFPDSETVRFDPERMDFVIGRRNRGSLGKGYRAVVYSAFTIGLMRYCLRNGFPHPGFVVIDTPLNPLKGREEGKEGIVNEDTKAAFYTYLASNEYGQIIVLENVDPPDEVQDGITYHHFSKNADIGRYGFYPVTV